MEMFEHSLEAKNVLNMFYGVDKILYVEGEDDVPFWEIVFEKFAPFTVSVEEVGGKNEIEKYLVEVTHGRADYLVARDSDYDRLAQIAKDHPNIIYTYGYSIENTLITENALAKLIKNICRLPRKDVPNDIISEWIARVSKELRELVIVDIKNYLDGLGKQVISDNCDRFMKSKNSYFFCEGKIRSFIESLKISLENDEAGIIEKKLVSMNVQHADLIRGHFLISAVHRFIKKLVEQIKKDIAIPRDMLFANLMVAFEVVFNEHHPHFDFYKDAVARITAAHNYGHDVQMN